MKLTEKIIKEFEEKSKILFTRGGLAVLLDYPPHDMILDEEEVKKFLLSSFHQFATEAIEAVNLEERGTKNYTSSHEAIMKGDYDFGYNSAISDMKQKAKKFLEDNY